MPLKIISWNCMNLSQYLNLDNPLLSTQMRCEFIAKTTNQFQPDILIIQEAGQDGKNVGGIITNALNRLASPSNGVNKYNFIVSKFVYSGLWPEEHGKTRIETYLLLYNSQTITYFSNMILDVNQGNNSPIIYRNAWALKFTCGETNLEFYLATIHAPNPSYDIKIRKKVISNALSMIQSIKNFPIIFTGDLNFKLPEQKTLSEIFKRFHFTWLGPSNLNNDGPANTSLKKPINQLRLGESTNQPYDQFWGLNIFSQRRSSVLIPANLDYNEDSMKKDFKYEVLQIINIADSLGNWTVESSLPYLKLNKIYDATIKMLSSFEDNIKGYEKTNKELGKISKEIFLNLKNGVNSIYLRIGNLKDNMGTLPDNAQTASILQKINRSCDITSNFLFIVFEGGSKGVDFVNMANYRNRMSDHLPISIELS